MSWTTRWSNVWTNVWSNVWTNQQYVHNREGADGDRSLNTVFGQIELFVTATRAADHGVVRDYGAAFVDISRLRASRRSSGGSCRVRLEPAARAGCPFRKRNRLPRNR
jgi:hypothetical protein